MARAKRNGNSWVNFYAGPLQNPRSSTEFGSSWSCEWYWKYDAATGTSTGSVMDRSIDFYFLYDWDDKHEIRDEFDNATGSISSAIGSANTDITSKLTIKKYTSADSGFLIDSEEIPGKYDVVEYFHPFFERFQFRRIPDGVDSQVSQSWKKEFDQ